MDKNFDEAYKNIDYKRIMDKVCSRYSRAVDPDDLTSIRLNTLWECLKKYDPTRGAKFTSYLYQQLTFAIKNSLKKRKREFTNIPIEKYKNETENISLVLSDLPDEYSNLLRQKYLGNMTMEEIGKENGYSRETARRKIKKALNLYKRLSRDKNENRSLMQ
jgi:RNA polymerase sigma factor (sigma-70 family)